MDLDNVSPRREEITQPLNLVQEFHPDETMRITYDAGVHAFYIYLHRDRVIEGRCDTETLCERPAINVDRIGGLVVGIEILT
jgi:uncharacterized protein YuzE